MLYDCMFCLFPTNKSDCNSRISNPLWPYTKNTEHLGTFSCLRRLVTPNKTCFHINQYSVRIQNQKPNGWKTQSNFVKHKIVPEIWTDKNEFVCTCVKLRMFWEYQYQHIKATFENAKLLFTFKFQTIMSHHIFICTYKL